MSNKKVLHLVKWYPNKEEPLLGIFIRKHIQSIQKYGINKVIGMHQTEHIKSNISRIENNSNNIEEVILYHKKGILNKIKVLFMIWKETRRFKPDIVHAHVMGWTSSLAYILSKINKTPFIISEHWSGYRTKAFDNLHFASKKLRKKSAKLAKHVCVVSKFLKSDMKKCGIKANYMTIGNVVDGHVLNSPKNETFTFVFTGDLIQETKNIKGILEAFYEIIKQHKNIKLEIIGDGKDYKNFKELSNKLELNDQVIFHGNQSNDFVFKTLSKSHVLIVNSYFETFSIICAEALLCGIPVISTKCGGPESFLNEETGILIDSGNKQQLEKAMRAIINTYDRYNSEKLKSIAKKFSMERIGEKINQTYTNTLG